MKDVDLFKHVHRRTFFPVIWFESKFDLDDALLADLRDELILAQRVAVDEGQGVLVWNGAVV